MGKCNQTDKEIAAPRRLGKHIGATLDYLDEIGATDVSVYGGKHHRVRFAFRGVALSVSVANSPRSSDDCIQMVCQAIRKEIRTHVPGGASYLRLKAA